MSNIAVTFDEPNHTYAINSVRRPGVTEVLTRTGIMPNFDMISGESLLDARDRGLFVHQIIEAYERGKSEDSINQALQHPEMVRLNIQGYFDAYRRWRDEYVDYMVAVERIVAHPTFYYCGRLDIAPVLKDGRLCIGDNKTGAIGKWVRVQCAAYLQAYLAEMKSLISGDLYYFPLKLNKDGTYVKPTFYNDMKSFQVFLAALTCVNFSNYDGQ